MSKRRLSAILLPALIFLGLGLLATVLVAFGCALWVDVDAGRLAQAERFIDEEQWLVTRHDRPGAARIQSVRVRGFGWSPQQAAGAPDTPRLGDQTSAWASRNVDAGMEWLVLQPIIKHRGRMMRWKYRK